MGRRTRVKLQRTRRRLLLINIHTADGGMYVYGETASTPLLTPPPAKSGGGVSFWQVRGVFCTKTVQRGLTNMSTAFITRSRDTSPDIERTFAKRINLGLGDEIPREIRWRPGAAAHFPPRNNHNVPYYKTETVFANAPQIEQFIHKLEGQLPYLEDPADMQRVVFTKSGRCSKCNCYFVGKGKNKTNTHRVFVLVFITNTFPR